MNRGSIANVAPTLPLLASTFMPSETRNDSPMRVRLKFWPMLPWLPRA